MRWPKSIRIADKVAEGLAQGGHVAGIRAIVRGGQAEVQAALEQGSRRWYKEQGIELKVERSQPMPRKLESELQFPIRLTQAQRKVVAEILPKLTNRLKLDEPNQRTISFTQAELKAIQTKAEVAHGKAMTGMVRNSLRHVLDATTQALELFEDARQVYQFKITLLDIQPPIWRRIQVNNCTLDKLHEHIQTAMGWTNSHLHDFKINGKDYGDPMLMGENFEEFAYTDSTTMKLSDILPQGGDGFSFFYHYDFGDSWRHKVLFEGAVQAEPGQQCPLCLEGERACPPEDVGGTPGYSDFVEAVQDRDEELLAWVGGSFDPEEFDPAIATARMRRGLPDWRKIG